MFTIRHACLSDRGKTHPGNEDRWFADAALGLYLVSDGMAHEQPAQLVVEHLPNLMYAYQTALKNLADPAATDTVCALVQDVSLLVRTAAQATAWQGLGATIVLAVLRPPRALLAHLGDSRIYLLRAGRLEAMTRDHSLLEDLASAGKIARNEMSLYAFNGGPTRFAGMDGEANAETRLLDLETGDRILLCSDGLTCMLDMDTIQATLNEWAEPAEACRALVQAANAAGGEDNITVLIVAADG